MKTAVHLNIAERLLPNGLVLLAIQNAVQTFACVVQLDMDLRDEAKGEEGLAYVLGSCLEEGVGEKDAVQLANAIDGIGGALAGSSSGGSVQSPAVSSAKAVKLLSEMVRTPALPARGVRRVREEVLTELKEEREDPGTVARRRFMKEVYGRHPYGRSPRGTKSSISAIKASDLRRFHRRWYSPHGGYVAASGPEEVEKTLDLLERSFRSWRGPELSHRRPKTPSLPGQQQPVHLSMRREQVHVYLGHIGVRRTDPDYYALSVMDHVLGTGPGFTSRISKKLRDEMGLCYSVHAGITGSAGEEPGTFMAYIGTSPEHREKAVKGFLREMSRIRREQIGDVELRDVQKYLTGSFVFGLERNLGLARYAIRAKRFDLGFDFLERYPELINSVSIEDVQRVAKKHLHPSRVAIVSAGA